MPGRLAAAGLIAVPALLLASVACEEESATLSGQAIVSNIPWEAREEAHYRLLDGGDEIGTGVLTIEGSDGVTTFTQRFESKDFSDEVIARADSASLEPVSVTRRIEGPEGPRRWDVVYDDGGVTVEQSSDEDERRDELSTPANSYDSWTDVFLWRTIAFDLDYDAAYTDVLTAALAKPEIISQNVTVKGRGTITVPAGEFDAWRVVIESSGGSQEAWYGESGTHPLLRYDNGDLVFELTALE